MLLILLIPPPRPSPDIVCFYLFPHCVLLLNTSSLALLPHLFTSPCTQLCVAWKRVNGPMGPAQCSLLANATGGVLSDLPLSEPASQPFTCRSVSGDTATVCGAYATQADASAAATRLNDTGLQTIALAVNLTSIYVPNNGQLQCVPSTLTWFLTDRSETLCQLGTLESFCAVPVPPDEFPYCACEPGVSARTPYTLLYNRKYSTASSNYFCFNVLVDRTQCGNARCCKMVSQARFGTGG
jgi:hypothetical protein